MAGLDENNGVILNNESSLESGYWSRSNNFNTASGSLPARNENTLQQVSVSSHSREQTPVELNDFPLEDDILLEEEIQRELEEVPPVVTNRSIDLTTERIPQTYRNSCNSSLNGTSGRDEGPERDKPVEATSKQKPIGRTVSAGDGDSTKGFPQHNTAHQACRSAFSSLENPREERQIHSDSEPFSKTDPEADQPKHDMQTVPCRAVEARDLDLDSPPFTYLSLLLAKKPGAVTVVKVKCFIVTLTGNLKSSNGSWGIKAKISDGSAYLEVNFADDILTSLIGFSVLEMNTLRKHPSLHGKIKDGLEKCQKQLIDLCCLMTIEFNPFQSKATVLVLQDVDKRHLEQLKKRLNK